MIEQGLVSPVIVHTVSAERSSEEILNEAQAVWFASKQEYRDGVLRVGKLICEFIVARLREGDGLPEAVRIDRGLTRTRSIWIAAERLGLKDANVNMMVNTCRVVELFGDPGSLSLSTLRVFTVYIRHKRFKVARGRELKEGEVLPSQTEVWEFKPTTGRDPVDLYQQAVRENWDCVRTREVSNKEIQVKRQKGRKVGVSQKVDTRLRDDEESSSDGVDSTSSGRLPRLKTIATNADPRDLADMILEMIAACPRMQELKQILLEKM